jgi:hypothetical protein
MLTIEIKNGLMNFRDINLEYSIDRVDEDGVYVRLQNESNDFITYLMINETTINGVLQTSAQMIIDTLSNGQS